MTTSILARLNPAHIVYDPFPHLHAPDALDADYYAELAAAFPNIERIAGTGALGNNQAYLLSTRSVLADPSIPTIWREFFAYHSSADFLQDMLKFWNTALAREYPDLAQRFKKPLSQLTTVVRERSKEKTPINLKADIALDCQFGVNSPVTAPTAVRGPHVDKPYKLFAGLLYFRHPQDQFKGGDLQLYRFKTERYHYDSKLNLDEGFVTPVSEIPYRPNTLVMWINTPRSLHGVSPRSITSVPRRYVNLLAECYTLPSDGFFRVKITPMQRALIAGKRLLSLRDA